METSTRKIMAIKSCSRGEGNKGVQKLRKKKKKDDRPSNIYRYEPRTLSNVDGPDTNKPLFYAKPGKPYKIVLWIQPICDVNVINSAIDSL